MISTSKKILDLYQCEFNRNVEETFSSILAERNDLRLFFVNENKDIRYSRALCSAIFFKK